MALDLIARGGTEGVYVTSATVGDLFTPAAYSVIALIFNSSNATALTSVSGFGASWSQIIINSATAHHMHIWAGRVGASPTQDQVSVTMASSSYSADVIEITGALQSGPVTDVFVQSQIVAQYNPPSPLAIPALATFASANNFTLTIGGNSYNLDHAADTGFTILQQRTDATQARHTCVSYLAGERLNNNIVSSTNFDYKYVSGTAFEIAEEPEAAGGDIAGDAVSQTTATGDLLTPNDLAGNAVAQTVATGDITDTSIDDVNGDETLTDGQTGNTLTTTEADPVTVVKLKNGSSELTGINLAGGSGSYTFDLPDISQITANTPACFFPSATHPNVVLEINNGVDDIPVTYNKKAGWAVVDISNPQYAKGYLFEDFTPGSVSNGCQVYHSTANGTTVDDDGEINTDQTSGYLDFILIDVDDYTAKPYRAFLGYTEVTGAAVSQATATGSLTTNIDLAGAAAALSVANGQLTAQITLTGAALSSVAASAQLQTDIDLSGAAVAGASGGGALTTQITLDGAAVSQVLASGDLVAGDAGSLLGSALSSSVATGDLQTGVQLEGASYSVSAATGDLTVGVLLDGAAVADAVANGSLTTTIQLDGAAVAGAIAAAQFAVENQLYLQPDFTLDFGYLRHALSFSQEML